MQSFPPPRPAEPAPAGAAPIGFGEPRGGGGLATVLTRPAALRRTSAHSLEPADDGTAIILGTTTAALTSVIVRAPGEHRVGPDMAPAEIQLRFRAAEGAQVALSIPVTAGPRSPSIDDLLGGVLDVHGLMRRPRSLAAYHGTETIPPFQSPVMWLVATQPVTADPTQLESLIDGSATGVPRALPPRPLQPSQGRPVVRLRAKVLILHRGESGSTTQGLLQT